MHQSTISDGSSSCELCDYPIRKEHNPGDPQGIKLYLQVTKETEKEYDKFYILVSNAKYIIDHFISLANRYDRGSIAFMVKTGAGSNNIFM